VYYAQDIAGPQYTTIVLLPRIRNKQEPQTFNRVSFAGIGLLDRSLQY